MHKIFSESLTVSILLLLNWLRKTSAQDFKLGILIERIYLIYVINKFLVLALLLITTNILFNLMSSDEKYTNQFNGILKQTICTVSLNYCNSQ